MDEINNHLHWSKKEKNFIRENIGVMTLEDMSKHVHRSVMAVRLLIHRNKWTNSNVLQHNPLIKLLKAKFIYSYTCIRPAVHTHRCDRNHRRN